MLDGVFELGEEVEHAYARSNYSDESLPRIAADALAKFDHKLSFGLQQIAGFLATTTVPQQASQTFSDLQLTLYRRPNFYIEILIWAHSTTSVHQHSFSGAFKVLRGCSLHTTFRYIQKNLVHPDLSLGELINQGSEYLATGSIRQIEPGPQGLIHCLFHLEQPSITLVVRSNGHQLYSPQYTFYRPTIALNTFSLMRDSHLSPYLSLLSLAKQIDIESYINLWKDRIVQLDFVSVAYLFMKSPRIWSGERNGCAEIIDAVGHRHGDLATHLKNAADTERRINNLGACRNVITDPDLRFFLALLMNIDDRNTLLALLSRHFDGKEPVGICADLLTRLSISKVDASIQLGGFLRSARLSGFHLGSKLGSALPADFTAEEARDLFESILRKENNVVGLDPERGDTLASRLAAIEELQALELVDSPCS